MLANDLFSRKIEMVPTRNGYGDGVVEAGKKNEHVMVLCCDLTESTRSLAFSQEFPERFLEIGVAEQNLVGVAAGLALEGKIPFCSSYAVFNPGRNWDQIRVSVCYNKANVKIVGAHAGISVGPDGATHQALEDIAITRVLPNMTVLAPCDYYQTKRATLAAAKMQGPVYIRFARSGTPVFTTPKTLFKIGKAQVFWPGQDVTIIGCGPVLYEALVAAKKLEKYKIKAEVINIHTIKPLDKNTIIESVARTKCVVTIEEHQVAGGLGSAVAELLGMYLPTPMEILGMPDKFGESGTPNELLTKYNMRSGDIVRAVKKVIKRK